MVARTGTGDITLTTLAPVGISDIVLNANVTGCNAEDVRIGMKVQVEWTDIQDGWVLPNFRKV